MFISKVRFTTDVDSLDLSIITQYLALAEKYDECSEILYYDKTVGVNRSWESEEIVDQYITDVSQLSEHMTVTKHEE